MYKFLQVMYILNVHGDRFISAADLIKTFYPKDQFGVAKKNWRLVLQCINSFTAEELWSSVEPEWGNIVVTKWIAEHNFPVGIIELDGYFFQIKFV